MFLDEVGDIPLSIQVKLLRLLETGTFRRVGSPELRKAEVRIISATHRPLNDMVADGRFRQDLFYRLNIFPIHLPPLRERGDDVRLLAESLLARVAGGRSLSLSSEALDWLAAYSFPGNVRELRNMLERACLLCDGDEIRLPHLPVEALEPTVFPGLLRQKSPAAGDGRSLAELLEQFAGNRKALAAHLGLSERTLYRRLQALKARRPGG